MKVFLTGATGFLGRALTLALRREGHTVVAWVRSVERARVLLGDQAELVAMGSDDASLDAGLRAALTGCDAVVNLAGEPVLARWTAARRAALRTSRVDLTARLVRALERLERRPRVLVSGSAVGFFGARGDEPLTEASAVGSGFLAQLCADWEASARRAESLGVRVVLLRTGIVLGLDGGALTSMLPPFRLGGGGRIGSGRQRMPWIHVEDWVRCVCLALADARVQGPLNATAPEPPTNREFTRALARTLRKPAFLPVPPPALRLLFGGAASVLLESQRALPARLGELGFVHAFPTLEAALADLLVTGRPAIGSARGEDPGGSAYLAARAPRYRLAATTELAVPLAEAFRFFSAPENLGLLTPRAVGLEIHASSGPPSAGSTLDHRIRIGPFRLGWRTRFEAWQAPERFVDVQEKGPYRGWWHEHRFEARGASATRMQDRVLYSLPLGPLGALAHRLFVADQLGDIFAQRALAIRLRFGARPA
jgi:uncharacterized protein